MSEAPTGLTFDDITAAAARLDGVAHRTPTITSRALNEISGADLVFKAENLQRAGAFKFRGAYNRIAQLSPDERARGVCAWSSGNHAQAVALAARVVGTKAIVLMPQDAPASQARARPRDMARPCASYDRYLEDREALARALADEMGMVAVPPFDDWRIMAGQGTAALELLTDRPDLDVLVVPMSGGGLMAGSAVAARAIESAHRAHRRRTDNGQRHPAVSGAGLASAHRRPAHDRRRVAGRCTRRAHVLGQSQAGR